MTEKNNPISRQKDLVMQEVGDEILIYDLKLNKACCLNETSALVWQLCSDGQRSVAEISQIISKKLKTHVTEDLVWLAIDQLQKDDLLEDAGEVSAGFEGLSRREVIRHIGLASLVALPVISSLIAPTAAHAASAGGGAANGEPCTGGIGVQGSCQAGLVCCDSQIVFNSRRCQPPDPSDGACGDITP